MKTSSNPQDSPEYIYAEAERTRQLTEELARLKVKPRQNWVEAISFFIAMIAFQSLARHIPLTNIDFLLLLIGFTAPFAALASRLYRAEKRVELLIKLLAKNENFKY